MKKFAKVFAAMFICLSLHVVASADNTVIVTIDDKIVDCESYGSPATIVEGRTLVPLRAIFEALGASVEWDSSTKTVTSELNGTKIQLVVGQNKLYKDDKIIILDVPAMIVNGRTMVPARAVSEAFDCTVEWNANFRKVVIITNKPQRITDVVVYDNNGIKITYKDYNFDDGTLDVDFFVENNSYQPICIQVDEASVNGYMAYPLFSPNVGVGKKTNATMYFGSIIKEYGITEIEEFEIVFKIFDWNSDFEIISNPIIIKPNSGSMSETGTGNVENDEKTQVSITNETVTYQSFVDFVTQKGSLSEGKYGISVNRPSHTGSSGNSWGTITLVYDPKVKELQLQVYDVYESNDGTDSIHFLTIDLPEKSDSYKWQFQYAILYPYYKSDYDYFMAAEGSLRANANSDHISLSKIITGYEIIEGGTVDNVESLIWYINTFGNNMFLNNGSTLSFEYFGIK